MLLRTPTVRSTTRSIKPTTLQIQPKTQRTSGQKARTLSTKVQEQPQKNTYQEKYNDLWDRHRQIVQFESNNRNGEELRPRIGMGQTFIAPTATLTGHVKCYQYSSIWHNAVLKGDVNAVKIGAYVSIGEDTVIHEALTPLSEDHDGSTVVGHLSVIGPRCLLRGCTIEVECEVGAGSVLEEGSYMETKSMLGPNSVLEKGSRIPTGQLWAGKPAKFVRDLSPVEMTKFKPKAIDMHRWALKHSHEFWLPSDVYQDALEKGLPIGFTDTSLSRFFFQKWQ